MRAKANHFLNERARATHSASAYAKACCQYFECIRLKPETLNAQ
jgi:hypothetical protein